MSLAGATGGENTESCAGKDEGRRTENQGNLAGNRWTNRRKNKYCWCYLHLLALLSLPSPSRNSTVSFPLTIR